ncbi:MFS transporter [Chitinophaga caeni]|uniref:MFS transporter n=1 Tax=Chitinophaga caeni TaxID=2029983 RepID=A0A291QTV0_9BACT|nr:MFS transporter [Chitinophaga caeni]ATL47398.1 MFS transporter [Chitinophaga caeni]
MTTQLKSQQFTKYQILVIILLAVLQFTIVLDFMVLSPLGAILMPTLNISASQFGFVVSAYAFSAGISGFLAAGFADKFDRKNMLIFFYIGFIIGTIFCSLAPDYHTLLLARIVTGMFGGVTGSIGFAIVTDLFSLEQRGRAMGFIQMAFGVSQVAGLPIGLVLANHYSWHAPFTMISIFGICLGIALFFLKPINEHLKLSKPVNAFTHLTKTLSKKQYLLGFGATTLMATGGFMLMPFGTTFNTFNLGIAQDDIPLIYFITGLFTLVISPLMGIASDKVGKFKIFMFGSLLTMLLVYVYTNLHTATLFQVIAISVVMFIGVSSRMIAATALLSAVPALQDRGAFMSINSSVQQLSGGIASSLAGLIVVENSNHSLQHFDTLGYVIIGTMIISLIMLSQVNQVIKSRGTTTAPLTGVAVTAE